MSTKTTFKRIALVAVAALGFGMLSAAPSSAAAGDGETATSIVVGTIPAARVGLSSYVPVKVYIPSTAVATDTMTITAQVTAAPIMGGAANAASALVSGTTENGSGELLALSSSSTSLATFTGATLVHGRVVTGGATLTTAGTTFAGSTLPDYPLVSADITAGYKTVYVKITPDVVGSYTVLVSSNGTASNSAFAAGDPSASFTISTGSAPTAVALTTLGGGTIYAGSTYGNAIAVTLVGGTVSGSEVVNLTTSGSGTISLDGSTYATTRSLTSTNFNSGTAVIWLKNTGTAAETISLTATGSGSLSSSITATKTYSVVAPDETGLLMTYEAPATTADYAMTNASETGNKISVTALSSSQSLGFTFAAAAEDAVGYVTVTDNAGKITGVPGLVWDEVFNISEDDEGLTLSWAAASTGIVDPLLTVAVPTRVADGRVGITTGVNKVFATVARTNSAFTISPVSTFLAAPGAAIALTATLKDQFGAARTGQTVTITTSGRNNPIATTAVTDSAGKVTFTTADASTSTTALTDTVSFAADGATTKNVTINYANTAVGTVTVTGGNTTASVNALTNTVMGISIGSSTAGVEAGAIDITATVKDALGNALTGVPVSFSVAGTTAAFTTTTATVYSGSTGTAVGKLYAWANGTYTYTITAGGKTTTGTATFGSIAAGNARVISATVAGNVVTGKAVDRLGNTVANVPLWAVATGGANIGGAFVATGSTGADGTLSWVVTGSGDVTVTAVNPALPAGSTAAQTCALEGNRTCATATTAAAAYAATVAGTTTTAEKHVGASFAPAGVASAKVTVESVDSAQVAADAAAEATDAANAATDAANAAAEAADAATAAAQDAADAVAALSTQVTELVSALRKQITSLTNLVIKIQKKVRA